MSQEQGAANSLMDATILEDHLKGLQSKESFERITEYAKKQNRETADMFTKDMVHSHNVAEHMLKVLLEENAMEPINMKVLSFILYNVVYGVLASTPGIVELLIVNKYSSPLEKMMPELYARKLLGF